MVLFDRMGKANGNMGVEYADVDGDLRLDLLTTTYQQNDSVSLTLIGTKSNRDAIEMQSEARFS